MILNASEDFKNRTLKVFPSLLEKLAYICSLRGKDGTYRHWGLRKAYGEQKADAAIGQVHNEMATETVKTSIRELCQQARTAESLQPEALVLNAPPSGDALLSDHLRLIQDSVRLVADQERSNPQGA